MSAVVSTTAGTVSKFNRMGIKTGFDAGDILMLRSGTCSDPEPNSKTPFNFSAIVNSEQYQETWTEGLNVYHNPSALQPLSEDLLPGAAHHHCDNEGQWRSKVPPLHPFSSVTQVLNGVDVKAALAEAGDSAVRFWKNQDESKSS